MSNGTSWWMVAPAAPCRMKWLPIAILAFFLLWCACAQENWCNGICGRRPLAASHGGSMRVIGGTDVLPGTWPWMVSIQIPTTTGYMHVCGGSLISPRWVVTAAHCFLKKTFLEHWKLVIGATQLSRPGPDMQERNIKTLVEHEQYDRRRSLNDIALMELSAPVNCSDYIQPACLPDDEVDLSTMTHCYVSGWGVTNVSRPTQTADIMQEARVNMIALDVCNSSNWYNMKIHYNNLCAGYEQGGIDSCQGDSGGPLECREPRSERFWVLGVTSWGSGCARAQKPGVYSSTKHFLDWIKEKTNETFLSPTLRPPSQTRPKPMMTTKPSPWQPVWQTSAVPQQPPYQQPVYTQPPPVSQTQYHWNQGWVNPWSRPRPPAQNVALTWPPRTRPPTRPQGSAYGQQTWSGGGWPPKTQRPPPPQGSAFGQQAWSGGLTWPPRTRPPPQGQQAWSGGLSWPPRTRPPSRPTAAPQWQPQKWTWTRPPRYGSNTQYSNAWPPRK